MDSGNAYVKTLLLAAGQRDGLQKGQPVVAEKGVVGRLINVGKNTSRILLITDINARMPVIIEGKDVRAIMTGDNSSNPVLRHLPADIELNDGDKVIASGHGDVFHYGMPIGTVMRKDSGAWVVKPYMNANDVTFVRVITSSSDNRLISEDNTF